MRRMVYVTLASMSLAMSACSPKSAPQAEQSDAAKPAESAAANDGGDAAKPAESAVANDAGDAAKPADDAVKPVQAANKSVNALDAMDKSAQVAEWFRTKQWDKIRNAFIPKLQGMVRDQDLESAWNTSFSQVGEFERIVYRLPYWDGLALEVRMITKHKDGYLKHSYFWFPGVELGGFNLDKIDAPTKCPEDCATEVAVAVEGFVTGNYAQFAANATDEFRKQLPENVIQEARNQILDLAGELEYVKSINLKDFVSHYYELKARHTKKSMTYTVLFDKEGNLQGFLVKPDSDADDSVVKGPESTDTWAESEVSFNADAQYPISGYLTLPKNVEKPPVVIFVHGSGCNDRNETVSANAPFRDIAHGLAERGIATLRYDKRCKLYPDSAAPDKVTIHTEATDDFDAAMRMLQGDARVDAKRIFVVGHSLGGMLVPYLADRHPELAGAISMSGTLRSFFDVIKQQQTLALAEYRKSSGSEATASQLESLIHELDEKVPKLDALPDDELIIGQPVRYWKSLRDATGEKLLANTKVPILVLWGSADMQIYAEDFDLWLAAEKKYPNLRCMRFDRLNHLMIPTTLENPNLMEISKDYAVASKVDAAVIEAIAGFVKAGK